MVNNDSNSSYGRTIGVAHEVQCESQDVQKVFTFILYYFNYCYFVGLDQIEDL